MECSGRMARDKGAQRFMQFLEKLKPLGLLVLRWAVGLASSITAIQN